MSSVESQWEGVSKQRFYQDYQQWQNQMSQFVDLLRQISQQLQATAERFRQVDQG
jgi:WXG100 family type VII secretion target